MVRMMICSLGLILGLSFLGCSGKTAEYSAKGAAAGAVSASLVGAVTDLIIDGRVNTHRLERNIVGGAVAGGIAGGVAGHAKDKAEKEQKESSAPPSDDYAALEKEIGPQNIAGLEQLINCRHKEAFALGLETEKSDNPSYSEAGLILQILVDHDRNNREGVTSGITRLGQVNDKIGNKETAMKELDALSSALQDERKIQGHNPICN